MLGFNDFLVEAKKEDTGIISLSAAHGPHADPKKGYYFNKYIRSHWQNVGDANDVDKAGNRKKYPKQDIRLAQPYGGHEAGTEIFPVKGTTRTQTTKTGKQIFSTKFRMGHPTNGQVVELPHNYVGKPENKNNGNFVDEHAVIDMANHVIKNKLHKKRNFTVQDLHDEIDKIRKSKNHAMHYSNTDAEKFQGKVKNDQSEESYYQQLRDASHTIHALSNHPDFKEHFDNGDEFVHAGRHYFNLSPTYAAEYGDRGPGATAGTSKADVIGIKKKRKAGQPAHTGLKLLSLKQASGSQLSSSSPAEFAGMYKSVLNNMRANNEIDDREHKRSHTQVNKIKKLLSSGSPEDIRQADDSIKDLHQRHDRILKAKYGDKQGLNPFTKKINREAITGEGKFDEDNYEGRATHIATIGKGAHVHSVDEYLNHYDPYLRVPNASGGKNPGAATVTGSVRLQAPVIPARIRKQQEKTAITTTTTPIRQKKIASFKQKTSIPSTQNIKVKSNKIDNADDHKQSMSHEVGGVPFYPNGVRS